MKNKLLITFIVIFSFLYKTKSNENVEIIIPLLEQVKYIRVRYEPWLGRFYPNGMGVLNIQDERSIGVESRREIFLFEEVYNYLITNLNVKDYNDDIEEKMFVWFHFDETTTQKYFISDKQVIKSIMYGLRDKITFPNRDTSNVEEVLNKHPLAPDDEQILFKYDYPDRESYLKAKTTPWSPFDYISLESYVTNSITTTPSNIQQTIIEETETNSAIEVESVPETAVETNAGEKQSGLWLYLALPALLGAFVVTRFVFKSHCRIA